MRILFANIGWMTHYQGYSSNDQIVGGGSFNNKDKFETYNFLPIDGTCYGFVEPVKHGGIKLERIDRDCRTDCLNDVLVVWIAKNPLYGGSYIVGWYQNATVYRFYQQSGAPQRNNLDYNVIAQAKDCTLVPVDKRVFNVPRGNTNNKGFVGQSNVWYADAESENVRGFLKKTLEYIKNYDGTDNNYIIHTITVDTEARKKVEKSAVKYVTEEYESLGYDVISREKDNVGWDLDAVKGKSKLNIEVKGLAQDQISVHITKNEYEKMMECKDTYRLCIVTNAIKKPSLYTFIWDSNIEKWVLDINQNVALSFESISYVAEVK